MQPGKDQPLTEIESSEKQAYEMELADRSKYFYDIFNVKPKSILQMLSLSQEELNLHKALLKKKVEEMSTNAESPFFFKTDNCQGMVLPGTENKYSYFGRLIDIILWDKQTGNEQRILIQTKNLNFEFDKIKAFLSSITYTEKRR